MFSNKNILIKICENLPNKTKVDDNIAAFNECVISHIEIKVKGIRDPPKIVQN